MFHLARKISALMLVAAFLMLTIPSLNTAHAAEDLVRLAGSNRFATSTTISVASFPGTDSAVSAVLANGRNFPDALAGIPLATVAGGPLLLTEQDALPDVIATELLRALPSGATVYVLGGQAAVSQAVLDYLGSLGFVPERISGGNRYETGKAIADKIDTLRGTSKQHAYLVSGESFPDALSISPKAALDKEVVLLNGTSALSALVATYLDENPSITKVTIVGGTSVVGAEVADALTARGLVVTRIAGKDRYETSQRVADLFVAGTDKPAGFGLASGEDFPDALSAGPQLASFGKPLLLSKKTNIGCVLSGNFIFDYSARLGSGFVYGGIAVIAQATEEYAERLMAGTDALGNCDTNDEPDPPPAETNDGGGNTNPPGNYGYDGIDKNCSDFSSSEEAQAYFEADGGSSTYNVDGLDADGDGLVCEWL